MSPVLDYALFGVGLISAWFASGFRFCHAAPHLKDSSCARLIVTCGLSSSQLKST